jgi:hypothetical protein
LSGASIEYLATDVVRKVAWLILLVTLGIAKPENVGKKAIAKPQ